MKQDQDGSVTRNSVASNTKSRTKHTSTWADSTNAQLIKRTVQADIALSRGARDLWSLIRDLSYNPQAKCFATNKHMGEQLGVSNRQVERYCQELVAAGLLKVTQRQGKSAHRELLNSERYGMLEGLPLPSDSEEKNKGTYGPLYSDQTHDKNVVPPTTKMSGGDDKNVVPPPIYPYMSKKTYIRETSIASSPLELTRPVDLAQDAKTAAPEGSREPSATLPKNLAATEDLAPLGENPFPHKSEMQFWIHADDRPLDQLMIFLRFQYIEIMEAKLVPFAKIAETSAEAKELLGRVVPNTALLQSLAKLLRANHADHIDYIEFMRDTISALKNPPTHAIWLHVAADFKYSVSAADLANPKVFADE